MSSLLLFTACHSTTSRNPWGLINKVATKTLAPHQKKIDQGYSELLTYFRGEMCNDQTVSSYKYILVYLVATTLVSSTYLLLHLVKSSAGTD